MSKHSLSEAEILRRWDEWVRLNKHAPLPSNPIGLSEEARMSASLDVRDLHKSEARRGLNKLVQTLMWAAGSAAADQKTKFTDTERERLRRHSDILPGAVAVLMDILTDHPQANVREYRLAKLFEALGSTTFIASHVIDNPTLERLRTAAAGEKNQALAQTTKVALIVGEELDRFRKQQSDEFRRLRRNGRGQHAIASRIRGSINKRLKNELRRRRLGVARIAQYLKKDPYF
jgi:hypothetical protein